MLLFKPADGTVDLVQAVGSEKSMAALDATHPKRSKGTWRVDEVRKSVDIEIGGAAASYILVLPGDGDSCILVAGNTTVADLDASWFGTPDFAPDSDDKPNPE